MLKDRKNKMLFSLKDFPLEKKTVLVRVDYNVPCKEGKITDINKIIASLPTIHYLLQKKCKIVLATHWGEPQGKTLPELKTNLLAKELKKHFSKRQKITKLDDCLGQEIKEAIEKGKPKEIFLLENLRFYKEEENNHPVFAHSLAHLADYYINEAFAVCHRKHASVEAITYFLPAAPGLGLEKEITNLSQALRPLKPAVWLMGGAKLDKIDLLEQALKKADYILIGGALAFPFLKAKNISVGMAKVNANSVKAAQQILKKKEAKKIILPLDFVVAESLSPQTPTQILTYNQLQSRQLGLDLGPQTINLFKTYLRKAHTIVWNGPLGYFEWAKFATSTKEIGRFLGKLTAITICGGGETVAAIHKFHLEHNLTHVSTGGGAALQFLAGKELPGIKALEENYRRFEGKISFKKS